MKTQNFYSANNRVENHKFGASSTPDTGKRPISNRDIHDLKKALRMNHTIPAIDTYAKVIAEFIVVDKDGDTDVYMILNKKTYNGVTYIEGLIGYSKRFSLIFNGTTTISDYFKNSTIYVEGTCVKSNVKIKNLTREEYELGYKNYFAAIDDGRDDDETVWRVHRRRYNDK